MKSCKIEVDESVEKILARARELKLAQIAGELGISRQGITHKIKQAEETKVISRDFLDRLSLVIDGFDGQIKRATLPVDVVPLFRSMGELEKLELSGKELHSLFEEYFNYVEKFGVNKAAQIMKLIWI